MAADLNKQPEILPKDLNKQPEIPPKDLNRQPEIFPKDLNKRLEILPKDLILPSLTKEVSPKNWRRGVRDTPGHQAF